MASTVKYLLLDSSYDPVLDPTACLVDSAAVVQIILTRLRLLLGEWWENLNLGLPVFQTMLGQLGSKQGLAAMQLTVRQNIEGAPYVTQVSAVNVTFADGVLSISVQAQTLFGAVTVSTSPGFTNASVGV